MVSPSRLRTKHLVPVERSSYENEKTVGLIARKVVAMWIVRLQADARVPFAATSWEVVILEPGVVVASALLHVGQVLYQTVDLGN